MVHYCRFVHVYAAIKYLCGLYMCVMTPVMIISVDYGKIVCLFMHMQSAGTKTPPYRYLGCSCLSEVIIE